MEPALRLIRGDAHQWSEQSRSCPVIRGSGCPTKLTEPRLGCSPLGRRQKRREQDALAWERLDYVADLELLLRLPSVSGDGREWRSPPHRGPGRDGARRAGGVRPFMAKAFNIDELVRRVRETLEQRSAIIDPVAREYTGRPFPFRDPAGRVALGLVSGQIYYHDCHRTTRYQGTRPAPPNRRMAAKSRADCVSWCCGENSSTLEAEVRQPTPSS